MSNTSRLFEQLSFAIFILCCSLPIFGKPVDEISIIKKRSVSEHQFMHDKSRSIQELQRRIWLHNVMGELHTAEGRGMTQPQTPRNPKHPATWPDSADLAVLLIKLAANNNSNNNEGTRTPLEQIQDTNKPGPFKYQNSKKNGKKKKQGKNNKRKAHRGREEKSRRQARSVNSEIGDPNISSDSVPLPTATSGRFWQ
ncbi:parathyroid hormone-related protein-like [Stegostoma tigrinum]|uniref:parathyroid hormone-related protein-like n=1 Tax=Stegostoma tigrinum TaxID=3053191 RepID=UPI00202AC9DC|nr:parathyroid hormone-related protein-like [Stegostoma tigrinum]XP_048405186.1 parathyroid hormone-related protein-like [Stegostoma tigrinum]XP_048405187.1 parathyroid hormone-related protein-like [Stegostoma tigrinum]XP_059508409.1 parathyroid hormone-related protein-like [Stegostoma tigrinum]